MTIECPEILLVAAWIYVLKHVFALVCFIVALFSNDGEKK